jgi:hypothetical protein
MGDRDERAMESNSKPHSRMSPTGPNKKNES